MGNKIALFLDEWDYLGQNMPTKEPRTIKVKDMILKEAIEARRAENERLSG